MKDSKWSQKPLRTDCKQWHGFQLNRTGHVNTSTQQLQYTDASYTSLPLKSYDTR